MLILLFFSFLSGLITILAPCIWPLLPIILSASSISGRRRPLGITLGVITSFSFFTLTISYIVKIIPFDPDILRLFAVVVIGFMGMTLIVPRLNQIVEGFVSRLSGRFSTTPSDIGFKSGFLTGFSLGLIWSPCAGPILATIATLAATQSVNFAIILVTLAYVSGVGIPLFILSTLGQNIFTKTKLLSPYTGKIQQVFGVIMIVTAVAIFTNFDKTIQIKLLENFPSYSSFINKFEGNTKVKKQLDAISDNKTPQPVTNKIVSRPADTLPNLGAAPEFTGITKWLNTTSPIALRSLKGKVVLVDFWTYTCINCIRTLPHVTSLYEKYKDMGFVVIGIHTPEFEFEKKTENVINAGIKQYNITYPVAQDNDYATWKAFDNHYWPAEYLIDKDGFIRRTHFGEGQYEEMEQAVQKLLAESGKTVEEKYINLPDQTPTQRLTPETYLGSDRGTHSEYLQGAWNIQPEFAESIDNTANIQLDFYARKVFLVIRPANEGDSVKVFLDGKLEKEIPLDMDRLYQIVELEKYGDHKLHLEFPNPHTKVFAFTFG